MNLKIEVQQRRLEIKKYKALVLDLKRELERLRREEARLEQEQRDARRRNGSSALVNESLLQRRNGDVYSEPEGEMESLRGVRHAKDAD